MPDRPPTSVDQWALTNQLKMVTESLLRRDQYILSLHIWIKHTKYYKYVQKNISQTIKFGEWITEVGREIIKHDLHLSSILGKKYVKAVYCQGCILYCLFNLYAEYIMRNARLVKHKLESRLLGEISITSETQMTPPLWQKAKKN